MSGPPVNPGEIMKLTTAFQVSRVLLAAVELELYTKLAAADGGGMTGAQIQEAFGFCPDIRRTYDFCDTLVSVGMLAREGNGDAGVYKNTPETAFFLDKAKTKTYAGAVLEKGSTEMYPSLVGYTEAIKDPKSTTEDPYKAVEAWMAEAREAFANAKKENEGMIDAAILGIAFSFVDSRTLLTAAEIDLYSTLVANGNKMTNAKIVETLGLSPALTPAFTKRLVGMNMLAVEGEGDDAAVYSCTPATEIFVDKAKLSYLGGILIMSGRRLYKFWGTLPEALKTGKAQNEVKYTGKSVFEAIYATPESLEEFCNAMAGGSTGQMRAFAKNFDFSKYKTHVDIGGSTGILACAVAEMNPNMEKCQTADLPPVTPIADKWLKKRGFTDENRVSAISIDFFKQDFPKTDVITMGYILHDWDLKDKKMLIKKAYDALPAGGAFATIDFTIDDDRREQTGGLCMSLNMLIETGSTGFDYTHEEFNVWCLEAGFSRTEALPLPEAACVACVAYK